MPQAWIHELSKQQVEDLASQMGLSTNGTLDELRKQVKEKWIAIEGYLPSQKSAAKCSLQTTSDSQNSDSIVYRGNCLTKVKLKLATDLISAIPVQSHTDPEGRLKFLIRARHVFQLRLISNSEFIVLLVSTSRTLGRIMQILGAHLGTTEDWGMVQSEIISMFLQRKQLTAPVRQNGSPCPVANHDIRDRPHSASADGIGRCWGCGASGHFDCDCSSRSRQDRMAQGSRDAAGVRQ
jgi:hypothetical protein